MKPQPEPILPSMERATWTLPRDALKVLNARECAQDPHKRAVSMTSKLYSTILGSRVHVSSTADFKVVKTIKPEDGFIPVSAVIEPFESTHINVNFGNSDQSQFMVFDLNQNQRVFRCEQDKDQATVAEWRNSSEWVSGHESGQMLLFDRRQAEPSMKISEGSHDQICGLSFSSGGVQIATGSGNGAVRVFDLRNSSQLIASYTHLAGVRSLRFLSEGLIISGGRGEDRSLKIFDSSKNKMIFEHSTEGQIADLFFKKNMVVVGYGDKSLSAGRIEFFTLGGSSADRYLTLAEHTFSYSFCLEDTPILELAASKDVDDGLFASLGEDENLRIWNMKLINKKKAQKQKPLLLEMGTIR